jgi:hypothetical protein
MGRKEREGGGMGSAEEGRHQRGGREGGIVAHRWARAVRRSLALERPNSTGAHAEGRPVPPNVRPRLVVACERGHGVPEPDLR